MTDAEIDARVEAMSDADVAELAANGVCASGGRGLVHYRPDAVVKRLASLVQELRAENANLKGDGDLYRRWSDAIRASDAGNNEC